MNHPMSLPLTFKVHRRLPELITPARPTPREFKLLSDIDDQQGLRFHIPLIFFYRSNFVATNGDSDPVEVVRRALAETLVYFYPLAGRLREISNRKLGVECIGEGVLFIEADADVSLAELEEGNDLLPPFPCFEELLFDVEGSSELLNSPLLLLQVTRLKCGGFILALRVNHTVTDGFGISLFLKSLCKLANGHQPPSVPPVWDRHLLTAKIPAHVTHVLREYDSDVATAAETDSNDDVLVTRSFFLGSGEISAIQRLFPSDLVSTTLDKLTSFLWRSRTVALSPDDPNTEMRLTCIVNARAKLKNPPLPPGYYGNALAIPVAIATAKDLTEKPLEFAVRLLQEAKSSVTEEYVRSVTALLATRGRPMFVTTRNFMMSDLTHFGFEKVDFAPWGKPVYGGPAKPGLGGFTGVGFYVPFRNKKGEIGIVVLVSLPATAMEKFVEELEGVTKRCRL